MSPASARSASESSFPPPAATPKQAASLRADLADSGWGVEAVAALLGEVAEAALRREIRLPALRAVRAALAVGPEPTPVAVLTALFMLGEPVPAAALDAALPRTAAAGAATIGLVGEPDETGCVRALVDLRPHEAVDDAGEVRWWVASDLGELVTGRALAPDHVLGVGGAGLTLAGLAPRTQVRTALDLGCGCGIQTLYLLRHAEHVVATDISARALAFTAFNAALAGVRVTGAPGTPGALDVAPGSDSAPDTASGAGLLELLHGSLLEPVAGRRFDLIASNPPFVLTPPAVREAGLPLMEYRDAGGPILPGLVAGLAEHLEPGATAVMLGNWEHRGAGSWRDAVAAWLPEELDAWILERELQDPVEYATMWLRDGGVSPERDETAFNARLGSWIDDFAARDIEGIGLGYLILHRPASDDGRREPWRILEEVGAAPSGPLGEHVAQVVAVRSRLAAMSDDEVAALHPVVAPDVTQERHLRPGASDPTLILIRQGGGFGRAVRADTALAALVDVADGELSVAQIASAVSALMGLPGADAEALRADLVAAARALAGDGFLLLP